MWGTAWAEPGFRVRPSSGQLRRDLGRARTNLGRRQSKQAQVRPTWSLVRPKCWQAPGGFGNSFGKSGQIWNGFGRNWGEFHQFWARFCCVPDRFQPTSGFVWILTGFDHMFGASSAIVGPSSTDFDQGSIKFRATPAAAKSERDPAKSTKMQAGERASERATTRTQPTTNQKQTNNTSTTNQQQTNNNTVTCDRSTGPNPCGESA